MPRYEFAFEATPQLGADALKCLLWKRGGIVGPAALIVFPLLLLLLAWDPAWRTAAGALGGAAIMLLLLFLLAVRHRRNVRDRFFRNAPSRVVRLVIDEEGVAGTSALGESRLPWSMIERVWRCKKGALLFYQGWQYIAVPAPAAPEGALEYAEGRIRGDEKPPRASVSSIALGVLMVGLGAAGCGRLDEAAPASATTTPATTSRTLQPQSEPSDDIVKTLVGRLDLEKYKAAIKGLTQFGDRRQGTDRNRAAVDWIEAQLRSFGCANTERIKYAFNPPPPAAPAQPQQPPSNRVIASGEIRRGPGGSRYRGIASPTSVNINPDAQQDVRLRDLNSQPTTPGPREEVYCTKVGATHPDEMYIVGAHMDGHGWGEAANDNASGTALVMEVARVFGGADVQTDRSIRFALWNNEETGLDGAHAYVEQRAALQGKEDPPGSGRYPEPKWLGMIQHDMMLFDHGMPHADGAVSPEQRPEADVNIEFQSTSRRAEEAMALAFLFRDANEKFAADYPAAVGSHMTNTDSSQFMDLVPAISLRENERGMQIGAGWDPHWHQATDRYITFSDEDFRLGLNAAQTTLGAIGRLAGATLKK